MNDKFHHFTIKSPQASGVGTEITMDGEELKGVIRVSFEAAVGEPNRVAITFIAGSLNAEDVEIDETEVR